MLNFDINYNVVKLQNSEAAESLGGAANRAANKVAEAQAARRRGIAISPGPTKAPLTPAQQSAAVLAAQKVINARTRSNQGK